MTLQKEKSVVVEFEGDLALITINRPHSLNALNRDVLISLQQALQEISTKQKSKVVVLTGTGEKAFVAGADIASMHDLGPVSIADYIELGQRVMRDLETFPLPVIAAVNGFALGGGLELALACDLIFAADTAKIGQPEVSLGIIPGFGGTQRLIHRAGIGTARRLCYSGEIISADEAKSLHIIDRVLPAAALIEETKTYALTIASKAPLAVQSAKKAIRQALDQPLLSGLRGEVEEFLELFSTKDREEGMKAFMQKRAANFEGK